MSLCDVDVRRAASVATVRQFALNYRQLGRGLHLFCQGQLAMCTDAAHRALDIFRRQLRVSAALRFYCYVVHRQYALQSCRLRRL